MNILGEKLYAPVSARVSSVDGVQYTTTTPRLSAFLGTVAEMLHRLNNRILTASTALVLGGSNASVAVGTSGAGSLSGASGIMGLVQGVPFFITGEAICGSPTSLISTASNTIRKVLVCIAGSALPVASSLATGGFVVQFVYGSAYIVSALAASTGGASAYFNLVPLPKASANQVPVGWLNVPNSFAVSATISTPMLICDLRETQGYDFTMFMSAITQP